MKTIRLSTGQYALVDDSDFPELSKHKWCVRRWNLSRAGLCYAQRNISKTKKANIITMHRVILGLSEGDGLCVDHINGNGLDNRRSNLRICSPQENQRNRRSYGKTSIYKGVSWVSRKQKKRWLAQIRQDGHAIFLGYHLREKEAALAYDAKAYELFGEYARLNFKHECQNTL